MSYQDIEQQLNQITNELNTHLKFTGIVDSDGKAVNIEEFNRLVENAITDCFKIAANLELEPRFDANSNNIVQSRIQFLRDMQKNKSISPDINPEQDYEQEIIEKNTNKEPGWMAKLWKRGKDRIHAKRKLENVQTNGKEEIVR